MIRFALILLTAGYCYACAPATEKASSIIGKWDMTAVRIYNEDASPQLNPMQDRWISFAEDGTFASGSGDAQENAGTYTLRPTDKDLHLDSDAGPGDDSDWRLTFSGDTLLMRGVGTERQAASEVVLVSAIQQ